MLILTRRTGETLKIGDEIEVTVLSVKGNQVRLGVNAPKDVPVHRKKSTTASVWRKPVKPASRLLLLPGARSCGI